MARLRRDSAESYKDVKASSSGTKASTLSLGNAAGQAYARRSPRKKTARSQQHDESSAEDASALSSQSVATKLPTIPQQKNHVRLVPLKSLQAPNLTLDLLSPRKGPAKLPSHSSLSGHRTLHMSPAGLALPAPTPRTATVTGPPKSTRLAETVEADVEESVWCGSDASSASSEDDLPSPRKFIKPLIRRTQPSTSSAGVDLSRSFKALSISHPENSYADSSLVLQHVSDSSRPTSSSDKENDHRAILRFSPPMLHSPRKDQTPERPSTPPPGSPSKGRLQSPAKRAARVPTPPLRQSLDAFWDVEKINDWNDQYSPRKEWSPRKLKQLDDERSASPTTSPRKLQSPTKRTKAEITAKKAWESRKHQLAQDFLEELDTKVTDGKISRLAATTGGVHFIWSKTLNTTAGRASWRKETIKNRQLDGSVAVVYKHHASIELAEKVIDDEHRLLNVIAHEFCHLANFMVSGIKDQPHGKQFKDWGRKCTAMFGGRGVEVTTKHSYQIDYKYIWQCSNEDCAMEFKRHSKSIDPKRHTCGSCRGKLVQIKPVPRKDAAAGGPASGYAAYVKKSYAVVKASLPARATQKEVMEAIARQYRAEKSATGAIGAKAAEAERKQTPELTSSSSDIELLASEGDGGSGELDKVARQLGFITIDDD